MQKLAGWVFILGLMYVAMTLYSEGTDEAFGGAFSWMSRTTESEAEEILSHTSAYTNDVPEGSTRKAVPITDAVRDRVNGHMKTAEQRRRDPGSD
jgi:hypothetical protein